MRCCVWMACGSSILSQSAFSLPRNRYAAMVSAHPPAATGMLAVGLSANCSTSLIALLLSRSSPKSSPENSFAPHPSNEVAMRYPNYKSKHDVGKVYNRNLRHIENKRPFLEVRSKRRLRLCVQRYGLKGL